MVILHRETMLLCGRAAESQDATFFHTRFEVPEDMGALSVCITTRCDSFCQIPFAVFSPDMDVRMLRTGEGGSGMCKSTCSIALDSSTSGGISGPVPKGTWSLVLHKRRMTQDVVVDMLVEGEPLVSDASCKPRSLTFPGRCLSKKPGWYCGELHVHSNHSTGRDSIAQILDVAVGKKLDFIAITDHFTASHWDELERCSDRNILLLQSVELSGDRGHANLHGISSMVNPYVDDKGELARFFGLERLPNMDDVADEVHAQGGLFCINHPDGGAPNAWRYHDFPLEKADLFEVWCTSEQEISMRFPAIWDGMLRSGLRPTGVCSSDSHKAKDHPLWAIGQIRTWVYAEELSREGILKGLKSGNVYMAKGETCMDFHAENGGKRIFMGDTVELGPNTVFDVVLGNHPAGDLFIYVNGQMHEGLHFNGGDQEHRTFVLENVPDGYVRLEYYDMVHEPRFWGDTPRTQNNLRLVSNPIWIRNI